MATERSQSDSELLKSMGESVEEISVEEAHRLLQNNALLTVIDVRGREGVFGHIKGAKFIEIDNLEEQKDKLPTDKNLPVLIYCASGILSIQAMKIMKNMGYQNVRSIRGGFNAWRDLGYKVETDSIFTEDQLLRYSRNMLLENIGKDGQERLMNARVLLVGAGGLGCPAGLYLAASGVGTLGIVDFDTVELSNLNRQVLHGVADVGRLKIDSAKDAINRINPDVNVITYQDRLTARNVFDIFEDFDIIVDATDSIKTKFLLNDACFFAGKPYIFGGAVQFMGQASVFYPKEGGPCLRCMFPKPPPENLVPT